MTSVEAPKAETDLEKAQRLSFDIVQKHFPVPPNALKAFFFFEIEEEEDKTRTWKLNVRPDGKFRIQDEMPIPNSLHGGGFIDQYSVDPTGNGTPIKHKNNREPAGNPEDVESLLMKLLPNQS